MDARRVQRATETEISRLAETLTRAFGDDPVGSWVMPDPEFRRRRSPAMFRVALRVAMDKGEVWTDHGNHGAALWAAPGRWKDRPRHVVRQLPALAALGRCAPRAVRVFRLMERHHPEPEHWYLDIIGTEPDLQGAGVGSALLRPILDRCDEELFPAYLVASSPSNVPFYERHGFHVTEPLPIPEGPTIYPMWRDPQGDRCSNSEEHARRPDHDEV